MSRLLLIGLVATAVPGFWAADVMAQSNKGFRDPYSHQSRRQYRARSFYYQPARPSTEDYRTFSYVPIAISPGDSAVVTGGDIKVMRGTDVVGTVPSGLKFEVTKVIGGWIGTVVEVDGKELNGWIWHKNVALDEGAKPTDPATAARPDSGEQTYRRYSYEPSRSQQSYPNRGRTRPSWGTQKANRIR